MTNQKALMCTVAIASLLAACATHREEKESTALNKPAEPATGATANTTVSNPTTNATSSSLPPISNTSGTLDSVIVTAQRRQESVQDMPLAVSVLSMEDLSRAGPRDNVRIRKVQQPVASSPLMATPLPNAPVTITENYAHQTDNPIHLVSEEPVSTFSIDVDTGAYANVRRFLNAGQLPPQDAVRVEEMINYFDYQYTPPKDRTVPFTVSTELATTPWNKQSMLLKVGIKGFEVSATERPAANLVFLVDVSGSMSSPDKLPLLKNAFRLLTNQLTEKDRVSMVVYAGNSGVVLEPTSGNDKHKILSALDRLEAGGSTNGAEGIQLAYQVAHDAFIKGGINRVVLATDGDFNVGVVNFEALVDMAERQRESGIAITTLGFGTGNYNDKLMERIADAGNGNYAYVDTLNEAKKVLVNELSSTLFTIAKDVKIQVEFNPAEVVEYRLIGYENRMLAREDFNNDKVDAGDIGAGHRVTALYEIVPIGNKSHIDPLRYSTATAPPAGSNELATVKLRYKQPSANESSLLEYPIYKQSLIALDSTSPDFKLAAGVAAFGQILRGGKYTGNFSYDDVIRLTKSALRNDDDGYRREFVSLVKLADALAPKASQKIGHAQ